MIYLDKTKTSRSSNKHKVQIWLQILEVWEHTFVLVEIANPRRNFNSTEGTDYRYGCKYKLDILTSRYDQWSKGLTSTMWQDRTPTRLTRTLYSVEARGIHEGCEPFVVVSIDRKLSPRVQQGRNRNLIYKYLNKKYRQYYFYTKAIQVLSTMHNVKLSISNNDQSQKYTMPNVSTRIQGSPVLKINGMVCDNARVIFRESIWTFCCSISSRLFHITNFQPKTSKRVTSAEEISCANCIARQNDGRKLTR